MKSRMFVLVMMVAVFLLTASVASPASAQEAKAKKEMVKAKKYYCPHHPNEVSDKPGKCPVCGMALVEMTDNGKKAVSKDMKMSNDEMKMGKSEMKGDMKKMNHDKMMKDSNEMTPEMKKMMKDTTTMKPGKM